jgi:hypothetical protein
MSKNKVVIGIVDAQIQAENIVQRLGEQGFPNSDISAIFPDKHGTRDFAHEHNTKAASSAEPWGFWRVSAHWRSRAWGHSSRPVR